MITGLRSGSTSNLILNEGAFMTGFDPSTYTTASTMIAAIKAALAGTTSGVELLGATAGGGSFKCTPELRTIDIDGMRGGVKGAKQIDSWDIALKGTLKELRASVFAKLLMTGSADTSVSNMTVITVAPHLDDDNYIGHMCWVGSTPQGMVMIDLLNVINTAGAELTFKDKDEGTVPFEFVAHYVPNDSGETSTLPVKIYWLTE